MTTGRVVAAVGELVHVLLVGVAIVAGVAGVGVVGFTTWRLYRLHRPRAARATALPPGVAPTAQHLPPPERQEIESGGLHLHLHGVSTEEVAAIIERQRRQDRP